MLIPESESNDEGFEGDASLMEGVCTGRRVLQDVVKSRDLRTFYLREGDDLDSKRG